MFGGFGRGAERPASSRRAPILDIADRLPTLSDQRFGDDGDLPLRRAAPSGKLHNFYTQCPHNGGARGKVVADRRGFAFDIGRQAARDSTGSPFEPRSEAMRLYSSLKAVLVAGLAAAAAPAAHSMPAYSRPAAVVVSDDDYRPQVAAIPRETVSYGGPYRPGTIIINTGERRLYLVQPDGQALKYGVGVGRPGFTWSGVTRVANKREWPDWTPPAQMLLRRPDLPRHMKGGIDNPLGARALYLGGTLFRIHGSNEPDTIGQAVSSGCIRMTNNDVVDLYSRVPIGAPVVVTR